MGWRMQNTNLPPQLGGPRGQRPTGTLYMDTFRFRFRNEFGDTPQTNCLLFVYGVSLQRRWVTVVKPMFLMMLWRKCCLNAVLRCAGETVKTSALKRSHFSQLVYAISDLSSCFGYHVGAFGHLELTLRDRLEIQ